MQYSEEIRNSRILIIDDDEIMRMVLRNIFTSNGFNNIEEATNGKEGWEKTLKFSPEIVFLDIRMPIMNGFEYCRKARANPDFQKMVILVETGLTDLEEKKNIFDAGATDYVSKPIDLHEILARSIVHLTNTHYLRELEDFNRRVKIELQSAKRLVDISLPSAALVKEIKERNNAEIFSYFQSSSEIGGDFWGVHRIDDDRMGIYIVDFSGHGVDSALNATRFDCLIKSSLERSGDPASFLQWLNNNLYSLLPPEQYATIFYAVVDSKENIMSYATAASPKMVIVRSGNSTEIIEGKGFPLGAFKDAKYANSVIEFNEKDALLLYSDAMIETPDKNGNFMSSLESRFMENYKGSEPALLRECFDMFIYHFMNDFGDNISDDATVVLCMRV